MPARSSVLRAESDVTGRANGRRGDQPGGPADPAPQGHGGDARWTGAGNAPATPGAHLPGPTTPPDQELPMPHILRRPWCHPIISLTLLASMAGGAYAAAPADAADVGSPRIVAA